MNNAIYSSFKTKRKHPVQLQALFLVEERRGETKIEISGGRRW